MIDLLPHITSFFERIRKGEVEIYNEFSLQLEIGMHLKVCTAGSGLKIQFERPVGYFSPGSARLIKKEIDIAVFTPDRCERVALELKFPKNGQYPEQMFKACQDVAFLEQLIAAGFSAGYFVMVVDDRLFYEGADSGGIYSHFRGGKTLCGTILKPTGARDEQATVRGQYLVQWNSAGDLHYATLPVEAAVCRTDLA